MSGRLAGIFIAPQAKAAPVEVNEVRVLAGKGLDGDRYAAGTGSFSRWPGPGRHVTLIESEVLADVLAATGIDLSAGRSRRNLVTAGVPLRELMHRTFRIGSAVFHGDRPADPCAHLERLLGPGLMKALAGRGGLRATAVTDGTVRTGDAVEVVPPGSPVTSAAS